MNTLFITITLGIIALCVPMGLCIYYKNKLKKSQTIVNNALDFLKQAGKDHFEVNEVLTDGDWCKCYFLYEGFRFTCDAHITGNDLALTILSAVEIIFSQENIEKARMFCNKRSKENLFASATYTVDFTKKKIYIDVQTGIIAPTEESFWVYAYNLIEEVNEIRYTIDGWKTQSHNSIPPDIRLNTWENVTQKEDLFNGIYYFTFKDVLFYLDFRISKHDENGKYKVWGKVFHKDHNDELFRFDMESKLQTYLKERSLQGAVKAAEDVVTIEASYFYNELMKIKNNREELDLDRWKELKVDSFTSQPQPDSMGELNWAWEDVALCGSHTDRRWRLKETCPECGTRLIELFMSSSADAWDHFCGRTGLLTFCPHCQKQLRFQLESMN